MPYNYFNIGAGKSHKLINFLKIIEKHLNKKAKIKNFPLQPGDVKKTHASINKLKKYSSYSPKTDIDLGIKKFIDWYRKYFKI